MARETLTQLIAWQQKQSRKEGVETYRVLPYKTLVEIAHVMPENEMALLGVKGIGAIKVRQYGAEILAIVNGGGDVSEVAAPVLDGVDTVSLEESAVPTASHDARTGEMLDGDGGAGDVFSVSDFLGALNVLMRSHFGAVRVRGEVVDFRCNHSGHAYLQIKDAQSIVRVTVFRGAYDLSGVELADGMEVIVTGYPQHHAQYGFSFIGETVELAGEGALKKAYDALKKKLESEGLMAHERKRPVPGLSEKIGLITSRDGAAIGDFMMNLGRHGFAVSLVHSAVEGQHAIHELVRALRTMHARAAAGEIDVLVLTRGGGSLESLQAFNNEAVIRAIVDMPVPVVAGIGHERDETLATLVADAGVSTPTAAAKAISTSWSDARTHVERVQRVMFETYGVSVQRSARRVAAAPAALTAHFQVLFVRFAEASARLAQYMFVCGRALGQMRQRITRAQQAMVRSQERALVQMRQRITRAEATLDARNPERLLARGYAIVAGARGVVRSVRDVQSGDELSVCVADGTIKTIVDAQE